MTLPLRHPAATFDSQASPRPDEVKPTVQSKETVLYCHLCERNFVNENGMRMHLATSKDHKKKVAMQELSTHAQDLKLAALLTPGTLASTILYGHLNHTQNILATPTYGSTEVGGYNHIPGMMGISSLYGQAGNAIKFPSQTSTEVALISTDLPQPDQIPNKIGTAQENSSSQKADIKHESLVPTVIPSSQQSAELESFSEHSHTSEDLLKNKYLLYLYTADNIAGLSRCQNCGGLQKNLQTRARPTCFFHSKQRQTSKDGQKFYPCCGERKGPPCVSLPAHIYGSPDRILEAKYRELSLTPAGSSQQPKRRAVTLDGEMAGVGGGMSEKRRKRNPPCF